MDWDLGYRSERLIDLKKGTSLEVMGNGRDSYASECKELMGTLREPKIPFVQYIPLSGGQAPIEILNASRKSKTCCLIAPDLRANQPLRFIPPQALETNRPSLAGYGGIVSASAGEVPVAGAGLLWRMSAACGLCVQGLLARVGEAWKCSRGQGLVRSRCFPKPNQQLQPPCSMTRLM